MDVGAQLRNAREARGLSIDDVARTTRISAHWLASIERNDVSGFPPGPYARGFVRAYAAEVGLEADATAQAFAAQFRAARGDSADAAQYAADAAQYAPDHRRDTRGPLAGLPAAISLALLLLAAWVLWPDTRQQAAEQGAVGTSGAVEAGLVAAVAAAPGDAVPPEVSPTAAPLSVTLETEHEAWVAATADGKRIVYRNLPPGTREVLRAERELILRVGDAGAVRWSVAGSDPVVMGARGAVRDVVLTPGNVRTVR